MRYRRTACLAAAVLLLAGCAGVEEQPRDRGREKIAQRQQLVWVLGEEYRFIWEPEVLAPVTRIGIDLSRAIGVPDNSFHFYVIDRPTVNAFTTPLGDIFVFSGMLSGMRSSSELAGVLAHEMAHVRANHFEELQKKAAVSSIPGLMAAILSRGDPRVIATTIAAAQSYQLHWSREMELESDRLALQYLRRTEYDPEGLLGALGVIERGERLMPATAGAPEGLMTHPVITSRIATMEGGLRMSPGETYEPGPDPQWKRMEAVLTTITERTSVVRQQYLAGAPGEGPADPGLAGLVLCREGEYGEAEGLIRIALTSEPRDYHLLSDLGACLFHQGKSGEAREFLVKSALEAGDEGYSYPHYYLGEIYREAGERESAFQEYRKAVESWPPLPEAHYQLALLLTERESLGEADYHFGKAAQLRGDFASALRSFSRAEARLGGDPVWAARISEELWRMQ